MTKKPLISEIKFTPIKPTRGVIGHASFVYRKDFYFGNIYICTHKPGNGKTTYRLGYPKDKFNNYFYNPINKKTQELIERLISEHIEQLVSGDPQRVSQGGGC